MEDFESQLQRKPEPGELAKESAVESQRQTFRRRHPDAVFKPTFAALCGNSDVVRPARLRQQAGKRKNGN